MAIFTLIGIIILGTVIAITGGYNYHKQKTKEKVEGGDTNSRVSALGASYLMSFGGILIVLGVTFLLEILK